jgi:hypothetical protein
MRIVAYPIGLLRIFATKTHFSFVYIIKGSVSSMTVSNAVCGSKKILVWMYFKRAHWIIDLPQVWWTWR